MSNTVTTNRTRETKSLLAKLMAAEDINVEYRNNVSTAMFDTENRTLVMPIFKDITDSTTDLFLGHEVGHALYTPQGAIIDVMKKGPSYKSLVNIVEDARIEKMIQSKFPGLSRNFYDGYSELMDRNFFGMNGRDVSDLNLFDRINVHFKIGSRAGVEFTDEEQVFVDRISKLRSFDDTIAVTDDLLKYCEDHPEDEEDEEEEDSHDQPDVGPDGDEADDDTAGDDNGETSDEPAENSNSDASSDSDGSDSNGEENNSVDSKGETDDGGDDTEKTVGSGRGGVYDGEDSMVSETMDSFDEHLKDLVDTETTFTYGRIPEVDLDKVIIPMTDWNALVDTHDALWENYEDQPTGSRISLAKEKFLKFRSENKSLVSYLSKEFEMRKKADEHKRTKVAKTGILNPNKLHSYKFNEDLFLRSEIITAGKDHGFIMYLDWSGSMHEDMGNTIDQLMLLALFCKKINVPFEAYAFTDRFGESDEQLLSRRGSYHKFSKPQINDIGLNSNFRLLHLVSSGLSTSKFQISMTYLARLRMQYPSGRFDKRYENHTKLQLGGTPLGECILTAINMVPEFQKKNNVQIVNTIFLTDGQGHGDCTTWDGTEHTAQYSRHSNLVIVDPLTKKHYRQPKIPNIDEIYMKVLGDRTKARVIGFYIAPTKTRKQFEREIGYSGVNYDSREEYWNDIKKNNFVVLADVKGYDQWIWVSSKSLSINTDAITIDSDMTKGRMKNAFVKQRQGKFGNKVMLSKLAEFVS